MRITVWLWIWNERGWQHLQSLASFSSQRLSSDLFQLHFLHGQLRINRWASFVKLRRVLICNQMEMPSLHKRVSQFLLVVKELWRTSSDEGFLLHIFCSNNSISPFIRNQPVNPLNQPVRFFYSTYGRLSTGQVFSASSSHTWTETTGKIRSGI